MTEITVLQPESQKAVNDFPELLITEPHEDGRSRLIQVLSVYDFDNEQVVIRKLLRGSKTLADQAEQWNESKERLHVKHGFDTRPYNAKIRSADDESFLMILTMDKEAPHMYFYKVNLESGEVMSYLKVADALNAHVDYRYRQLWVLKNDNKLALYKWGELNPSGKNKNNEQGEEMLTSEEESCDKSVDNIAERVYQHVETEDDASTSNAAEPTAETIDTEEHSPKSFPTMELVTKEAAVIPGLQKPISLRTGFSHLAVQDFADNSVHLLLRQYKKPKKSLMPSLTTVCRMSHVEMNDFGFDRLGRLRVLHNGDYKWSASMVDVTGAPELVERPLFRVMVDSGGEVELSTDQRGNLHAIEYHSEEKNKWCIYDCDLLIQRIRDAEVDTELMNYQFKDFQNQTFCPDS